MQKMGMVKMNFTELKKMSQTKVINTDRANSPHYYYVFL